MAIEHANKTRRIGAIEMNKYGDDSAMPNRMVPGEGKSVPEIMTAAPAPVRDGQPV